MQRTQHPRPIARRCAIVAAAGLAAVAFARPGGANDAVPHEARGHERSGYDLSTYENVNLANGNLTFRVPLAAVQTDGGLAWELALHHNSKVWYTHRYCSLIAPGYDDCQSAGGLMIGATVAHGIEAFGFGWDLRPPRVLPRRTAPFARATSYVDASGAQRRLGGAPPWEVAASPAAPTGPEWSVGDRLYSRDGSNLRFEVTEVDGQGRALRIEMQDGYGDLYVFGHVVAAACDATESLSASDVDLTPFNFRVDVAGLYLTEIQRGPWAGAGPANRITFEYAATSSWDADCDGPGAPPWLPTRVTASGQWPRSLEIEYDPATWTVQRVTTPGFNPVIGDPQPSPVREEIVLSTDVRSFNQRNGATAISFDAVHLTEVTYPDGASFRFDELLHAGAVPLSDVVLPSGGRVEYSRGPWPVGQGRCEDALEDGGDCSFWLTCGTRVPRIDEERSRVLNSDGITYRSISYRDAATGAGAVRRQSTWFMQGLNCLVSPSYVRPPLVLKPWPYDLDWALRDDAGLRHAEYLWTVVYTSGGLGGPGSRGVAEIHRFHPLTREEFSVDLLAGDSDALAELPLLALVGVEDLEGSRLRVLRHTEIERELLFGPDIPAVTEGGDRYTYVRERRVFTDETGDAQTADVESCHPPVFADPTGPPSVTVTCAEVRETTEVDDYLNPTATSLTSLRSAAGIEVARSWQHGYMDEDAELDWLLHRETDLEVCDGSSCAAESRSWDNLSGPGSRRWFVPSVEVTNPGPGGACTSDCILRSHGYDAVGNRDRTTVSGGYGVGTGALVLTTRTEHRHGRPARRLIEGAEGSLLAWEREIDPGTGLPRVHMAGDGAGFGYVYDGTGRLTGMSHLVGEHTGGGWDLQVPQASDGTTMLGTRLDRVAPSSSQLLRHELRDASYTLMPIGAGLRLATTWVDPQPTSRVRFDGLGRSTLWSERYPSGSGTRSRMDLDLFLEDEPPCGTGQGSLLDHMTRVRLASEWRDDAEWSSCQDLDWTENRLDPLGRAAVLRLPDGSESFLGYVGDRQTTVQRWVATDPSGTQQLLATVRLEDALGRLRALDEELSPGLVVAADYEYDHGDRLVDAFLWEGAPGGSPEQHRHWTYSGAGFPTAAVEPERNAVFLGWDAMANLRSAVVADAHLRVDYDGFGRRTGTRVNGVASASWVWGDAAPANPAEVGEPGYGRVVEAVQHNRFGVDDVPVTSIWSYGGPGRRLDRRATAVGGIGLAADRFEVGYGYDRWGNAARVDHPVWVTWPAGCQEPVREEHESLGQWLLRTGAVVGDAAVASAGTVNQFHASGRVAEMSYEADGSPVGQLVEVPDDSGMPRPAGLELWWRESPTESSRRWLEAPFGYDGSGNVIRIGQRRFAYDGLDRLTEHHDEGLPVEAYSWDRWGNLTELANSDAGGFTLRLLGTADDNRPETVSVDGGSGSLGWSLRGNLTSIGAVGALRAKHFTYSGEDRLMAAVDDASGTTWRYAYDAAGERVLSWRRGTTGGLAEVRLHLRDEAGLLLSEWTLLPGQSFFGPARDYVRAGGRAVARLDWTAGDALPSFIAHDHLGSTRVVIEPDGTMTDLLEYYPFGGLRSGGPSPSSNLLFTGHERDLGESSSELDFMHARYYSPVLARFASVDTVGGDPAFSQSFNRYTYTRGNPLRATDPTGLYKEDVHRYLTQYLALRAGRSKEEAAAIADANQGVDDETPARPGSARTFRRHFDTLTAAMERAGEAASPEALGEALHSVQDSFSHSGYHRPFGHLFDSIFRKDPDSTATDPEKAMLMARASFELLGGDPAKLDDAFLEALFRMDSEEDRTKMLREMIEGPNPNGISFFVNGQQLDRLADYYESHGYRVFVDGLPYHGN